MAFYDNNENADWNANHLGCRVPINDTDLDGAPFNLSGADPAWEDGSINKAVYETHLVSVSPPVHPDDGLGEDYILPFSGLLKYVNNEMLYGYSEDSRYTVPGDMMSYRAYPTSIISLESLTLTEANSLNKIEYDGAVGVSGNYVVLEYVAQLKFAVPYDIHFTISYEEALTTQDTIELQIAKGFTQLTHYREVGGVDWIPLPDAKLFFSYSTEFSTGQLSFTTAMTNFIQAPYYGSFKTNVTTVEEGEYSPGGSPLASLVGTFWFGFPIEAYETRMPACREASLEELDFYPHPYKLFLADGDTLALGTTLWRDKDATLTGYVGSYITGQYEWTSPTFGEILRITLYLRLDANGVITYIDVPDQGYLESQCYELWYGGAGGDGGGGGGGGT